MTSALVKFCGSFTVLLPLPVTWPAVEEGTLIMGFQLHFFGVKEVFFFQFPEDPSLGLDGGSGESCQLFDVCPFLPHDGTHSLD